MAQHKIRPIADAQADLPPNARLADSSDRFIASPARTMQQGLWSFAGDDAAPGHSGQGFGDDAPLPGLYPGWLRLTLPLVLSGLLWVALFGALRLLGMFAS